jgi:hypothetical protein
MIDNDDDDSSKGNCGKIGENNVDGKIANGPTYTTTMTPQSSRRESNSENLATAKDFPSIPSVDSVPSFAVRSVPEQNIERKGKR